MQSTNKVGTVIRQYRKAHGESIVDLAQAIGVERAYLNKIELGSIKPSLKLLDKIFEHFSIEGKEALGVYQMAGYKHTPIVLVEGEKEGKEVKMSQPQTPLVAPPQPQQIAVDPLKTPVLYTDSVFVNSSDFGLVLDVAQSIGGQQQTVVARIGMSFDHAKRLVEVIKDHLQKYER